MADYLQSIKISDEITLFLNDDKQTFIPMNE